MPIALLAMVLMNGITTIARAQLTFSNTGPVLSGVESMADGYALLGSGFGVDPSRVQIFEGKTQLVSSALVSVTNARIVVRSTTRGLIDHKVVVAAQASGVVSFTHAVVIALAAITVNPAVVEGRQNVPASVTLSAPAPAGGAIVSLAVIGGAGATVPQQVVIAAGQVSAIFQIATDTVAAPVALQVSATYGRSTKSASIQVKPPVPPPELSALALSPAGLHSGATGTGTVTLTLPAPAGGANVSLTSSRPEFAIPATVTVPAGSTTGQFSIQAAATTTLIIATISASIGTSAAKMATITLGPTPITLTSMTLNPASVQGTHHSYGTVTLSGPAPAGGTMVTITSSRPEAVGTTTVVPAGSTIASFSIATQNLSADATATISAKLDGIERTAQLTILGNNPVVAALTLSPATLLPGGLPRLTIDLTGIAPPEGTTITLTSSSTDAPVPATVTVTAGAPGTLLFIQTNAASPGNVNATITAAVGATPAKSAVLTISPRPEPDIFVQSLTISPTSVQGGESAVATVTLSRAAPAGGTTVNLTSTHPQAPVTWSNTVAAGATTAQYSIHTTAGAGTIEATVSAAVGQTFGKTAQLSVRPIPINVSAVSVSPAIVQSGATSAATVTLSQGAPAGGARITLTSSSPKAVLPATHTISPGSTSGQFTIQTGSVTETVNATISAQGTTDARTAQLSINPLSVVSLTLDPATLLAGATSSGTVTLGAPAPAGGATVALTSSRLEATAPSTVTVPAGASSAQFTVQAGSPSTTVSAILSAATGTTALTNAQLTINGADAVDFGIESLSMYSAAMYENTRAWLVVRVKNLGTIPVDGATIVVNFFMRRTDGRTESFPQFDGVQVSSQRVAAGQVVTLNAFLHNGAANMPAGSYEVAATLSVGGLAPGQDSYTANNTALFPVQVQAGRAPGTNGDLAITSYQLNNQGTHHDLVVNLVNQGVDALTCPWSVELEPVITQGTRKAFEAAQVVYSGGSAMAAGATRQLTFRVVDRDTNARLADGTYRLNLSALRDRSVCQETTYDNNFKDEDLIIGAASSAPL